MRERRKRNVQIENGSFILLVGGNSDLLELNNRSMDLREREAVSCQSELNDHRWLGLPLLLCARARVQCLPLPLVSCFDVVENGSKRERR